ncbi:MAG: hypothetical protein ABIT20_05220 [Gemmatimonadaceae bacterium]
MNAFPTVPKSVPWDADVAPVMTYIESEPTARPAMVALAGDNLILRGDLVARPPSEAEGVAALIAEKIADVLRDGSAPPSIVRVRHAAVADALRQPLKALGVPRVTDAPSLSMLEEFLEGMRKHVSGLDRATGAMSQPATWAGWDFPPRTLSAVLDAAAVFHAAQPWLLFGDADTVKIESPTGSVWYACILGKGGQTFGLALYEKVEELAALLSGESKVDAFARNKGAVVTLNFDARSDIAPPLRKELTKTGRYPVGSQGIRGCGHSTPSAAPWTPGSTTGHTSAACSAALWWRPVFVRDWLVARTNRRTAFDRKDRLAYTASTASSHGDTAFRLLARAVERMSEPLLRFNQ